MYLLIWCKIINIFRKTNNWGNLFLLLHYDGLDITRNGGTVGALHATPLQFSCALQPEALPLGWVMLRLRREMWAHGFAFRVMVANHLYPSPMATPWGNLMIFMFTG